MTQENRKHQQSLEEVQQEFEAWRKIRKHRSPIPIELWDAAVSLSNNYSIHKISKALHLNHTQVRDRVAASTTKPHSHSCPQSAFVEIAMPSSDKSECIVAMENRYGERMTMHFTGEINLDLLALSGNFLGRRK